ncbi:tail fiber domain-containing protein [Mesorhizobium sp. ZMM04-5]|uniref:Tail fiber domain-containing protein n=1 Tax=Mesorhizobium marinum TaxID=3228790 RepID=A0ABV3QXQ7_9HYPH
MKKVYCKPELRKSAVLSNVTANGAGSLKGVPSDIRLKTDIKPAGTASNGLPLYDFRYLWSDEVYRGVMAQDVLEVFPDAVTTMPNGYLAVRYDMLGLEMTRVH